MISYTLEWPGALNIPFVIIDPSSKKVFCKENPLPIQLLRLNSFENKYVKLSSIISLFSDGVKQDAQWILQDLLEKFTVKPLISVTTTVPEKCVTTYLPLSTLLAFVMIWPCCKVFQSLQRAVVDFFEDFSETLCRDCGWTRKECECDKSKVFLKSTTVVGFGRQVAERSCQTDGTGQQETNINNVSSLFVPANPPNMTVFMPQNIMIPSALNIQVFPQFLGPPMFPQSHIQLNPSVPFIQGIYPHLPAMSTDISHKPSLILKPSNLPEEVIPSKKLVEVSEPSKNIATSQEINSSSAVDKPNPLKSDVLSSGVNYIRPLVVNSSKESTNGSPFKQDNLQPLYFKSLRQEVVFHDDNAKKVQLERQGLFAKFESENKSFRPKAFAFKSKKRKPDRFNCSQDSSALDSEKLTSKILPKEDVIKHSSDVGAVENLLTKDEDRVWQLIGDCAEVDTDVDRSDEMEFEESAPTIKSIRVEWKSFCRNNNAYLTNKAFSKKIKTFKYMPTGEEVLRCTTLNCGLCFDSKKSAQMHFIIHSLEETYQASDNDDDDDSAGSKSEYRCPECNFAVTYNRWFDLLNHIKSAHQISMSRKPNSCYYCGRAFENEHLLAAHFEFHNQDRYKCKICQNVFYTWDQVQKHIDACKEKDRKDKRLLAKRKTLKCPKCISEFKNFDSYADHVCRVHDLIPYTLIECPQCNNQFRSEKSYEWHAKEVHAQEISCEKCSYATTSKSFLKLHMTQKHGGKNHACTECNKSFDYFQQLRAHMAHHARTNVFSCQNCDKEFLENSELRAHQQADHSEMFEKTPASCSECEYRCHSKSSLNAHMKKIHPELMDVDIPEKESVEQSYFNKTVATPSPPSPPPLAPKTSVPAKPTPASQYVTRRGRKRKVSSKYDWSVVDDDFSEDDKRDRKRAKIQKECQGKKPRLSFENSCARTQTYEDHKLLKAKMAEGPLVIDRVKADDTSYLDDAGVVSSPSTASVIEDTPVSANALNYYPYRDHCYCKFDFSNAKSSVPVASKSQSDVDKKSKVSNRTPSPDRSGAGSYTNFPLRTTRRQAALAGNSEAFISNYYSPPDIVSSIVPVTNQLYNINLEAEDYDCELTKLDGTGEGEVIKYSGGHNLLNEVLGCLSPLKTTGRSLLNTTPDLDIDSLEVFSLCSDDYGIHKCDDTFEINGDILNRISSKKCSTDSQMGFKNSTLKDDKMSHNLNKVLHNRSLKSADEMEDTDEANIKKLDNNNDVEDMDTGVSGLLSLSESTLCGRRRPSEGKFVNESLRNNCPSYKYSVLEEHGGLK